MSRYPGLCDKYGASRIQLAGIFAPAATATSIAICSGQSLRASLLAGIVIGFIAVTAEMAAIQAHIETGAKLAQNRTGLSKGSAQVIKSQLKAYMRTLVSGTALSLSLLALPGVSLEDAIIMKPVQNTSSATSHKSPIEMGSKSEKQSPPGN